MSEQKPKCVVCGKPAAPHERTTEGTYLHTLCAMAVNQSPNLSSQHVHP